MIKRISITISGRVQGVGFRFFAHKNASSLGLVGYVRNSGYNQVEVVAEGEERKLLELLEKCKTGPSFSNVENIVHDIEEPTNKFIDFEIK